VLLSCTTDAYDKGDGEYSLLQAELADVYTDSSGLADHFITDNNERISIANSYSNSWMTKADTTYRAVVYFMRSEETSSPSADIFSTNPVGVIVPKRLKKADTMKTDPVRFESAWMSRSGHYYNVALYLMSGATTDSKALHVIGCVADTLMVNADSTRTAYITLYHDQGGRPEYYSQRSYLSIPLDSIPSDSVNLTINTYDGPVIKTFSIK
jgi:hypothetical protein